jgi:hypothetical protein
MLAITLLRSLLTELAELPVGDDQRPKGSSASEHFIALLLGNILLHWRGWELGVLDVDLFGVPNELLQEISLILREKQELGLLHNVSEVSHKLLAFCRELLRRSAQFTRFQRAVQRNVDLLVLNLRSAG